MINPFVELSNLFPKPPLLAGQVVSVGSGTVTVQYPGGGQQVARGTGYAVGAKVFVQDGAVDGAAPTLTAITIEV
jgi:hypothetical protein